MKKLSFLLVIASVMMFASCGNRSNEKAEKADTKATTIEEQYLTADLKIKLDSLAASVNRLQAVPFVKSVKSGKVVLTEKEKKVKPEYLLPLSKANDLVTKSEKARTIAAYGVDRYVAELYDMPIDDYNPILTKLASDINSSAIATLAKEQDFTSFIQNFYDEQFENGTLNIFWESITSALVESIYITTQNVDKFVGALTDEEASEITYRFALAEDGIVSLIPYHEDMKELNVVLEPLYKINAINKQQLRDQLIELKGEIEAARKALLK